MIRYKLNNKYRYLLLWAGLWASLYSCTEKEKKEFKHYRGPIEEVNDVKVLYSENGKVTVELKTPKQYRYPNEDKVFPDTVNVKFFDETGAIMTTVRSDSGRYEYAKNIYTIKGNVIVVNARTQEFLYTSELNWNPVTQKVYNDKFNKILRKNTNEILNGTGLDAKQDFTGMSLRKINGISNVKM